MSSPSDPCFIRNLMHWRKYDNYQHLITKFKKWPHILPQQEPHPKQINVPCPKDYFFTTCNIRFIYSYPTLVLLLGKSYGQRSLVGCSPWDFEVGHDFSLFTLMHWRRKWQPTPVFLPGESQGQKSLVGCRLWGRTESDTTEAT